MPTLLHILLLEDSVADAELIWKELRRGGIEHVGKCVGDSGSFREALSEFRPELILADYNVPGWSGLESVRLARSVFPDVPVIIVAGSIGDGRAAETLKNGATDYILKPNLSQLVPAVERALREAEERKQRRRAEVLLELKYQQLRVQNDALQQSEERFRQLAEAIHEVFWMTDAEKGQMLYISPGYERIWGRSCASLYQAPSDWLEAVHPEDRERVAQALHKQAIGQYNEEYRIVRPDGSLRWIHDRAFPVRDETGVVYRLAGVAEDVTARKQLERNVLEISDREQSRIGADLHDGLCQLLVSIGFNAHALKQDLEEQAHPEVAAVNRITQKLGDAIKLARHLAHGLCPVNFQNENLETALTQLARNTSEDYGICCAAECCCADGLVEPASATHVYRIAQEAVHNAVKHASPGQIVIRLEPGNGKFLLTVTDDGCGIGPAAASASGMGLEIMKYRSSMLCGTLEIRPRDGSTGGTIVACSFPQKTIA